MKIRMRRRLIPFSWRNIILGLSGKSKNKAKAEYYYEGEDLERLLIQIEYDDDKIIKELKLLGIDKKYGLVSDYEHDKKYVEISCKDASDLEQELLTVELRHNKITALEYEKQTATLKKEPWVHADVRVPNARKPFQGYFDIDWNNYFIEFLESEGFTGETEEILIERWLKELNSNLMHESGVDDPYEDGGKIKTKRKPLDDARAEYS